MAQDSISKLLQVFALTFLMFVIVTPTYSQATKKRGNPLKSSGSDYTSRSTQKKNSKRGGRSSLPVGVDGKTINIGFGAGIAMPSLSINTEEHATTGINSHLYAHYLFGNKSTFGLGVNFNSIYLGSKSSKFMQENQNITEANSYPWIVYTASPSLLSNYTITQRISTQFLIQGGGLFVTVPENRLTFTDSIKVIGEPTIVNQKKYVYKTGVENGWFVSGALQFNYALTKNMEARVGLDYFYGRFNYHRINESSLSEPSEKMLREMKLIDLFVGLAFSF